MKKKLSLVVCSLVIFVFGAKAQYANMPLPIVSKSVSAYSTTKISFSPDSRYLAVEYKDVLEKPYTTIIEVTTGKEVTPNQTGYPWKETTSTKYKTEGKNIADKITGKLLYGIDECVRCRYHASTINLSSDNNMVALVTYSNNPMLLPSISSLKAHEGALAAKKKALASQEGTLFLEGAGAIGGEGAKEIEQEKKKMLEPDKGMEQKKKEISDYGNKLAQIEVFRISELPKYHSSLNLSYFNTDYNPYNSCENKVGGDFAQLTINESTDVYYLPTMKKVQAPQGYKLEKAFVSEGMVTIKKEGNSGLMDLKTNKIVLACEFRYVKDVIKQKALVYTDKGIAVMDIKTKKTIWSKEGDLNKLYKIVKFFENIVIFTPESEKHQLIDVESGKVIAEYPYIEVGGIDHISEYTEGEMLIRIRVKNDAGEYGIIDAKGQIIKPFK